MIEETTPQISDPQRKPLLRAQSLSQGAILGIGLGIVALYVAALAVLGSRNTYDVWGALLVAPVLVALALPVLARQARRENDPNLFWLLLAALLVHLILGWIGQIVAFHVFGGKADATQYVQKGQVLAQNFRHGLFAVHLRGGAFGTSWPAVVVGSVEAIIGATSLGTFLVFSWLGFWGSFYFYRAFRVAVPEGRSKTYARLLFFLPSLAFWSSFLGKDSWMVFGMGVAVFGIAQILTGNLRRGILPFAIGIGCMLAVRPHIAGMLGLALAFGFVLVKQRPELRELAPVGKILGLLVIGGVAVLLLIQTQHFLRSEGIDTNGGLASILSESSAGGSYGGSAYSPPIVHGPIQLPAATVTVLFRPFPTEAGGVTELLAATEATFLLLLTLWRWRWGWAALRSVRRQPFVAFCIAYVAMAIVAFSAFANFGLLDRERVQLLPLYLVLLSIPPKRIPSPSRPQGDAHAMQDRARYDG